MKPCLCSHDCISRFSCIFLACSAVRALGHMLDGARLFSVCCKQIGNSKAQKPGALWNLSSSRGLICNLWASCLERQNMPPGWSWRTLLYNYPVREGEAVSILSWYMFFPLLQVASSLTWSDVYLFYKANLKAVVVLPQDPHLSFMMMSCPKSN